jgi:hypothetical protein
MYDESKIEEIVLALFGAFEFENGRVWKQFEFGVMNSLHEKGYIHDSHNKSKSFQLTSEGLLRAKELAAKYLVDNDKSLRLDENDVHSS